MITARDLKGIIPPIVTPVNGDETVDYDGLRCVVQHVLDAGVGGVFALGGTGNFCAFTHRERWEVARAVIDEVQGRVPVLVGCMDTSTRLTIANVERAQEAGADAVVVETPYYYHCSESELESHFSAIVAASQIPVVIYHNPEETKLWISLPLTRKLANISNVIGIKDSSYDFVHFQTMLTAFERTEFSVLQGQDPLAGPSFLLGSPGAILSMATIVPRLCVRLFQAASAGDLEETLRLQRLLTASMDALQADGKMTTGSFFAGLECAMNALGLCSRVVTTPYAPPSNQHRARVDAILNRLESAGFLD